jgi:hypothetical protein
VSGLPAPEHSHQAPHRILAQQDTWGQQCHQSDGSDTGRKLVPHHQRAVHRLLLLLLCGYCQRRIGLGICRCIGLVEGGAEVELDSVGLGVRVGER